LPYINDDDNWIWLQAKPAKAARWLGYVPFTAIIDERNSPPVIHRAAQVTPGAWVSAGEVDITIPDADDIEPRIGVHGFEARQPYHLVFFGEKSSLSDVVLPIAVRYDADVYLPTGEISDTLLYRMAADGAGDGRPMQVFTLSDCDPSGYQMPVSIGRKLQALRDLSFPDLEFEVRPIALLVEQVAELGLPSTPLKETERRASRWRVAFGVEQTEIDALATLRPDVLADIIFDAISPFHDRTLTRRVAEARLEWLQKAQWRLDEQIDQGALERIRSHAETRLATLRTEIDAINAELRMATGDDFDLPPIEIPGPIDRPETHGKPLVSSAWEWPDQTEALKARKSYANGSEADR
jgi:hypothetical protein